MLGWAQAHACLDALLLAAGCPPVARSRAESLGDTDFSHTSFPGDGKQKNPRYLEAGSQIL